MAFQEEFRQAVGALQHAVVLHVPGFTGTLEDADCQGQRQHPLAGVPPQLRTGDGQDRDPRCGLFPDDPQSAPFFAA